MLTARRALPRSQGAGHLRTGWLVLALLLGLAAAPAFAQVRVGVAWDTNTDGLTAGYRVFVGTSPGAPLTNVDVGAATSAVLPLAPGIVYYVSVRGYSAQGALGPPSGEQTVDLAAAPGAPTGFGANVNGATAVLEWSPPTSGGSLLTYLLSVGTAPGASNLVSSYSLGDVLSVSGNLPPGIYFARLHAVNLVGAGPASAEIGIEVGGGYRPLGPVGLNAAWVGARASLTWSPPSGATPDQMPTSYVIEAGSLPGAANLGALDVGNTTSYAVDVPVGTFYVRVRGANARGISDPSNEIALQGPGAPGPARNLTAAMSGGVVTLRWAAPASGGQATSYVVEAGRSAGASDIGSANVGNVASLTTAVPPGVYYVRVRAVNDRGAGSASNEVVVQR